MVRGKTWDKPQTMKQRPFMCKEKNMEEQILLKHMGRKGQ